MLGEPTTPLFSITVFISLEPYQRAFDTSVTSCRIIVGVVGVARSSSHSQSSVSIQAYGAASIQNINGQKIPGAPNGMLVEMANQNKGSLYAQSSVDAAYGTEPIQNVDAEKIPGAPNGMLAEMAGQKS